MSRVGISEVPVGPTVLDSSTEVGLIAALLDTLTGALKIVDYTHHEIHDGKMYITGNSATGGPGAWTVDITLTAPADKHLHLTGEIVASADCTMQVLKRMTLNAIPGGTLLDVNNHNDSAEVPPESDAVARLNPTIDADGDVWFGELLSATKNYLGRRDQGDEFIFRAGETYGVRLSFAGAGTYSIALNWYEKDA